MNIFKINLIINNICEYLTIKEKIYFAYICKYKGRKISPEIMRGGNSDFKTACENYEYGRIRYFIHIKKYNMKYIFKYELTEFMDFTYTRAIVAGNIKYGAPHNKRYYYYVGKAGIKLDCDRAEYIAGICAAGRWDLFKEYASKLNDMGSISINIILDSAYKRAEPNIINYLEERRYLPSYKLLGLYKGGHIDKFNRLVEIFYFPVYLFSLVNSRVNKLYIEYLLKQNINNTDILILICKCRDLEYFKHIESRCCLVNWREIFIHCIYQNGNIDIIKYVYSKLTACPALNESLIKDYIYDVEIIEFIKKIN